jgi:hypothetical protein
MEPPKGAPWTNPAKWKAEAEGSTSGAPNDEHLSLWDVDSFPACSRLPNALKPKIPPLWVTLRLHDATAGRLAVGKTVPADTRN